ncbi:PhzF family phenazine biosynthesis isomerase [Paenibacillus sp. J2TS4]|uniref:PhzF family phenazine biosynthesis isomerase n=1 Tax=Paenibacillus sp. J2TS4 TaxID=2807194 RepID=UPI001B074D77|nr:PhzF family phenazine biosynthesis isomerase [Paenibacillus sp. J2TS4]GIP34028.1 isomerase [Paenibacillus sp. J2TS4]
MNEVKVYHYDAFSTIPNKGNPAGVVLDTDGLAEKDMQNIARQAGFSATAFVLDSDTADFRLKYFTPGHEINLCGHATVAALFALKQEGKAGLYNVINIETNVGVLPIEIINDNNETRIKMKQENPQFISFHGDVERLCHSIGLSVSELDSRYPIVYGSTGIWTLLIPVKSLVSFKRMTPNNDAFPNILIENSRASLHPFSLETIDKNALMHARHFSSPYSGTVEDPVTGTASGVMGAYYLTYIKPGLHKAEFIVEQGQEINRDGRVKVEVCRVAPQQMDIYISGTAVSVNEFHVIM